MLDDKNDRVWVDEDEVVQGLVLLRKEAESLPALKLVEAKIEELNNTPGRLPPGVKIEPFYDRTDLINTTTETVEENLLVGIVLVTVILLMFLSNVRSAIIIAINLPLALLFAFGVLYARGQSANLLSIGAVDFGIIVDSTVIMVENIYRVLSSGAVRRSVAQRADRAGGPRNRAEPVFLDADHGLRDAAAVHHERARRPAVPPDGRNLCLRHRRRTAAGADHRAGPVPAVVSAT